MESVMDFICVGSCRLSRNKNWNHQETVGNHRKPPGNHPPKTSETTPESFDGQSAWSHVCVGTCGCHRDRTQNNIVSPGHPHGQRLKCFSVLLTVCGSLREQAAVVGLSFLHCFRWRSTRSLLAARPVMSGVFLPWRQRSWKPTRNLCWAVLPSGLPCRADRRAYVVLHSVEHVAVGAPGLASTEVSHICGLPCGPCEEGDVSERVPQESTQTGVSNNAWVRESFVIGAGSTQGLLFGVK